MHKYLENTSSESLLAALTRANTNFWLSITCGLQEAVSEWRRDSARALSRTAGEAPLTQALRGMRP